MNKKLLIDRLLTHFIEENSEIGKLDIPNDYSEKRKFLRALMNVRRPMPLEPSTLKLQNELLVEERNEKGIVDPYTLPITPFDKLVLWRGDITTIAADAIVNAANSKMLGCFVPLHKCIDNAIHSAAGVQLRLECDEIMKSQGFDEPTGQAKITQAYNLPSKYVVHTVGPIIYDKLTDEDCNLLKKSYISCLEKASEYEDIKSIAFCCISTGEFRFPKDRAASLAFETVTGWLSRNPDKFDRIIFNVFTEEDYYEYAKLFKQNSSSVRID